MGNAKSLGASTTGCVFIGVFVVGPDELGSPAVPPHDARHEAPRVRVNSVFNDL